MDRTPEREFTEALARARALAARGQDEAARQAYLDALRCDPTDFSALNELANLALSGGFRAAARTAYLAAVQHHPGNKIAHVNLANLMQLERDVEAARRHYEAALAIDPDMHEAHQGLGWVLDALSAPGARWHRDKGYTDRAVVTLPYRGAGEGTAVLLLVSALGGNIFTRHWLSERRFRVTALYVDYCLAGMRLPPHSLIVNAIGDADRCGAGLERAQQLTACSDAPVINAPARVLMTRRIDTARRFNGIEGVIVPAMRLVSSQALLSATDLRFPLLLRRPGFHNGEHFVRVEHRDELSQALAGLGGDDLLLIDCLDARGPDGMTRKYRVMFIDGILYPLHLAISTHWKVHYSTSSMRQSAALRAEERRFLEDMPGVLGARAMGALAHICVELELDYAGIDFALAPNGSVMLFEVNATMIVLSPDANPIWDYRREPIDAVMAAAKQMVLRRIARVDG